MKCLELYLTGKSKYFGLLDNKKNVRFLNNLLGKTVDDFFKCVLNI